jgi:hypothetical protein
VIMPLTRGFVCPGQDHKATPGRCVLPRVIGSPATVPALADTNQCRPGGVLAPSRHDE